jgi:hypothetical protein
MFIDFFLDEIMCLCKISKFFYNFKIMLNILTAYILLVLLVINEGLEKIIYLFLN